MIYNGMLSKLMLGNFVFSYVTDIGALAVGSQ